MIDRHRLAVALVGLCALLQCYAPQSLLPLFRATFGASPALTGLTVSATTLGIAAMAPFSGLVADVLGRKRIIVGAIFALTVPTALAATAGSIHELVLWRFCQGLLLPPIFSVVMAYIGDEWPTESVAAVTALYIAGSGLGGFFGRLIAGFAADLSGWRAAFVALAVFNLLAALAIARFLPRERGFVAAAGYRSSFLAMARHFANPLLVATLAVGFLLLFSLVGTFTYIAFHLAAPPFSLSAGALGLVFATYLAGVVATPMTGRWIARLGRRRLIAAVAALWCAGLGLTLIPFLPAVIAGLALVVTAGFVVQAAATSLLASATQHARSSALGLYTTCYYLGGSAGGVVPGFAWAAGGWPACAALVAAAVIAMAGLVWWRWRA